MRSINKTQHTTVKGLIRTLTILALALFLLPVTGMTQDDPEKKEKTEQEERDREREREERWEERWEDRWEDGFSFPHRHSKGNVTTDFFGLDIGINGYGFEGSLNLPGNLDNLELNYGQSWEITFHLIKQRVNIYKNSFRLVYGPEFNLKYYRFTNDITLVPNQPELTITNDDVDYKKNRLRTSFISLPVMLEFEAHGKHHHNTFRFSAGGYISLLMSAGQKQKSKEFGVQKVRDDFNLNKFRYGLIGKIGIGHIGFYAKYALNGLFQDGEGPELHPFTIGVTLFSFR